MAYFKVNTKSINLYLRRISLLSAAVDIEPQSTPPKKIKAPP